MAALDDFARNLFEEAKWFYEKGCEATTAESQAAHFHGSLVLAFCSLEAHTNAVSDDFLTLAKLCPEERSILAERRVELTNEGKCELTPKLQIYRIEERLLFLSQRFSGKPLDKKAAYWGKLSAALHLRNDLTHPNTYPIILGRQDLESALNAILEVLDILYKRVYKKGCPLARLGLKSQLIP